MNAKALGRRTDGGSRVSSSPDSGYPLRISKWSGWVGQKNREWIYNVNKCGKTEAKGQVGREERSK